MSLITKEYTISDYPNNRWIIEIENQHYIINDSSKLLLDILCRHHTYTEALEEFNLTFKKKMSEDFFLKLVSETFQKTPFFNHNLQKPRSFIKFQRVLFTADQVKKLSKPLEKIFNQKIFWVGFTLVSLIAFAVLFFTEIPKTENLPIFWLLLFYFPTMLLHELGHAAACRKSTGKNGEIGIGIYFIFPVLYTDISAIWHAKKTERIIGNLAGVYMQLLCAIPFFLFFFFTNNNISLGVSHMLAFYSFFQLIPFIRSDGYWLLSDLTSVPNLHQKSRRLVNNFLVSPIQTIKKKDSNFLFLLIYGVINYTIIIYYLVIHILYQHEEILHFPYFVLGVFNKILHLDFSNINFQYHHLGIIIFYILTINILTKNILKLTKRDTEITK